MMKEESLEKKISQEYFVLPKCLVKSCYGTVVALFTIPSSIRKATERQTFINKDEEYYSNLSSLGRARYLMGSAMGFFTGLQTNFLILNYMIDQGTKDNYLPIVAWSATNVASLISEAVRDYRKDR